MMLGAEIPVLHIRQSASGGGGADTVLRQHLLHPRTSTRVKPVAAYLHKPDQDIASLIKPLVAASITVHSCPGHALLDRAQLRRLSGLIEAEGIRILHAHDPKSNVLAWMLSRRHGLPIVSTLHGWTSKSWKGRLYRRIDCWVLKRFDQSIAVSQATRELALNAGLRRIDVIPNSIDIDNWPRPERKRRKPQDSFTVGWIGRLSVEKRPADVVHVARRLASARPRTRFLMVGDGPERRRVESLIKEMALDDCIELTGALESSLMPDLFRRLDAVLLTSRTEGLPLALLEAGAMSLAAVATRAGGAPEVIVDGETGFLADIGDTATLAERLERLRRNPKLAQHLGEAARRRIEARFLLGPSIERVERIYADLLGLSVPG